MRFPGQRIARHYFPVSARQTLVAREPGRAGDGWYLLGLDQVLVDVEVHTPASFVRDLGLAVGESIPIHDHEQFSSLMAAIERHGFLCRYAPGGTVANTLNNFAQLSAEPAVLLGAIQASIRPGEPAFHFVAQTHRAVSLEHLVPREGSVGTALTFITPDGDRSFAVWAGVSNDYPARELPEEVVRRATAVLASLYPLGDEGWPICAANLRLMELAREAGVPVAFGLGTAQLVHRLRPRVQQVLEELVTIAAMNSREAEALTGQEDVLLACQQALEWVDVVIVTQGSEGMTIGGYVDRAYRRQTRQPFRSKSIAQYNRYEYSRLMRREDCEDPIRIYTHIHPYQGGPARLANTSGAGDAALAAVLHDVAANRYHRTRVPDSAKHPAGMPFLTYSSLSRNAQYGNRVAYEVLKGASPRLEQPVGPDR
jgi:inosine kinase